MYIDLGGNWTERSSIGALDPCGGVCGTSLCADRISHLEVVDIGQRNLMQSRGIRSSAYDAASIVNLSHK